MKKLVFIGLAMVASWVAHSQNLNRIEYFIDTDPGYGSATNVPFTAATIVNDLTFSVSLSSVSDGFHTLYVRSRDVSNKWSVVQNRAFYKVPASALAAPSNLSRIEYFIDTDPGYGAATSVAFTASATVTDLAFAIPLGSVSDGFHTLYIRSVDANNKWSVVQNRPFYKVPASALAAPSNLSRIEYFIDTDPGYGSATSVAFTAGNTVTDLVFSVDVSALPQGPHKLYVRSQDSNNKWSIIQIKDFSVCNETAPASAAATSVTTTGFTANWAAVVGATSYRLDVSVDNFATFVSGNNDRTVTGATSASVTGLIPGTTYQYRVRAVNTCTSASSAAIAVATLFSAPTATAATAISSTGFTANWNTLAGAANYRLDVSADNFSTFITGYNNKIVTGTNEIITGLTPSTSYKYRVRAVSAAAISSPNSNEIAVATLAPPAAPVANAATTVTSTGFTANWSTVSGATGYRLDVSLDNFSTFLTGYNDKAITANSEAITGLTAATSYKYRVRTVSANGISANSNVVEVITAANPGVPAAPVGVAASGISTSGFTANWNGSVGATGYLLDISTDNFTTFLTGYNAKTVSGISEVITNLTAATAYKYRVRAVNAQGTSTNSNVIDVTTLTPPPAAPVATNGTNVSQTSFTANWNSVIGATGYQLDVSADNFATFLTAYNSKAITTTSEVVTGLSANTAYKYRVRAVDANGVSGNSNIITTTTLAVPVTPPPVATAATVITQTGFTANWNPATGATGYRLDVSEDNFANFLTGYSDKLVTGTSEIISGLTAATSFKYRVRATDANGTSVNSNTITVTTLAKQSQAITFDGPVDKTLGDTPFTLLATANSGLPVAFEAVTPGKLTIAGNTVTLTAAGTATIRAKQEGDATYNAATPVERTFCIKPAKPVISIGNENTESATLTSSAPAGNKWLLNGTAISGATGATLAVSAAGSYTVQVIVEGCASEPSNAQVIIVTGDGGSSNQVMRVYPNPVADKLIVDLSGFISGQAVELKVVDLLGRSLLKQREQGGGLVELDVRACGAATYYVTASQQEKTIQVKFVKE